jgi:hypothetical protein
MNPFSEIKSSLRTRLGSHWDALPSDNPARVRVGNRFARNFLKPTARQAADFPAVDVRRVETRGMKLTSTSGHFLAVYEFGITSDERASTDDTEALDESEWQLIRCAVGASSAGLGLSYVHQITVESSQQTVGDATQGATQRWTSAVRVVIEFSQPKTEIIPS